VALGLKLMAVFEKQGMLEVSKGNFLWQGEFFMAGLKL
jgi:hypothetical protein